MAIPIYHVDAFVTEKPFSGNPAGVCILERPANEDWMKGIAREMNLSETAFLDRRSDGFNLRWFTPTVEVALCGHATLGSAHVLWERKYLGPDDRGIFHTKSGVLTAVKQENRITLDFPAKDAEPIQPPSSLLTALGVTALYTGKNQFDYLVEVGSDSEVLQASPNFSLLRSLSVRGVIVTARSSTPGYDFISRFFAPGSGIDEDPVTGSAHCALGPYWQKKLKKDTFVAYQASARGGILSVRVNGDRVSLAGRAVTVMQGEVL
ncbi:MAG TPA: PhzF family phenazine biosynthesis protein [Bacteroidota bacterium]|nr:PhzF family phenazine biosynthesis protein [Bacteroidota bacterium]